MQPADTVWKIILLTINKVGQLFSKLPTVWPETRPSPLALNAGQA